MPQDSNSTGIHSHSGTAHQTAWDTSTTHNYCVKHCQIFAVRCRVSWGRDPHPHPAGFAPKASPWKSCRTEIQARKLSIEMTIRECLLIPFFPPFRCYLCAFTTETWLSADLQSALVLKKEKENLWIYCSKLKLHTGSRTILSLFDKSFFIVT